MTAEHLLDHRTRGLEPGVIEPTLTEHWRIARGSRSVLRSRSGTSRRSQRRSMTSEVIHCRSASVENQINPAHWPGQRRMEINMNTNGNGELVELIDRYIAMWNKTDTARRRGLIAKIWADGASYLDRRDPRADIEFAAARVSDLLRDPRGARQRHEALVRTWLREDLRQAGQGFCALPGMRTPIATHSILGPGFRYRTLDFSRVRAN
jgi:hypothetical protein